tara:strand:- start:1054 stop:1305 length:252 start_codon:yes stop_codon:yes gene_type:complete
MSDYKKKDNEGALFKNEKKETDKHPDYIGVLKVDGQDKNISAWINTAKNTGKVYMKLTLQNPFKKDNVNSTPVHEHSKGDLPF